MQLDEVFVEKQRKSLLEEKKRLEDRIKQLKEYPDYGSQEEDNLQEVVEYENNLSIEEQMDYLLKKVNNALEAIENGTYGQCKACRSNVEQGRLEAMPYVDLCVTCERDEK